MAWNRTAGVLLPITCLYGPYGIGVMGEEARAFISFLHAAHFHLWQMLPVGHTGECNSPYKSISAFAGNPLIIDPRGLYEKGMITKAELADREVDGPAYSVDYNLVRKKQEKLLRKAPQAVRIKGEDANGDIKMEIESDFINSKGVKMGNTRRHFTARALKTIQSKWAEFKNKVNITDAYKVDRAEIYTKYFHGPSFQVLDGIINVDENAVLAVYKKPAAALFADGERDLIAYPMLIEAAFQTCGYRDMAVENRSTLPDYIGKLDVHGKGPAPQKLYILGVFNGKNIEGKSIYDAFVFDEKGKLWIELQDYQMIGQ